MNLKKWLANIPKSDIFQIRFIHGFSIRAFFIIYLQSQLLAACYSLSLWERVGVRVIKKAQVAAGSSTDRDFFYFFSTYPACRLHLVVYRLQDILMKIDGVNVVLC
jgi:hypothetical protein